ncbi:MAG: hypothetical protein F3745_04765 [Nitrospinae bacterium]|nr:hypothetical protein [Nitrospinota bacterium]
MALGVEQAGCDKTTITGTGMLICQSVLALLLNSVKCCLYKSCVLDFELLLGFKRMSYTIKILRHFNLGTGHTHE